MPNKDREFAEAIAAAGIDELNNLKRAITHSEKPYCEDPLNCSIDALYEDLTPEQCDAVLLILTRFAPYIRARFANGNQIISIEIIFRYLTTHLAANQINREILKSETNVKPLIAGDDDEEWPENLFVH
jgi:hypothetical protein